MELAQCFDADIIAKLDPSFLEQPARSCTGRAKRRQTAAFAEAGRIGLIEERNVAFHFEGVMRIANLLGIIEKAPPRRRAPQVITRYLWVAAPANGIYRYAVEPAEKVSKGALLATVEDVYGERIGEVTAPADGLVLWRITHALATKDSFVVGLGTS
jgi:predicted deacylase